MIVSKDGSGDFNNLQDAIDSIPENNSEKVTIFIKEGIYKQKVFIDKPFIELIGENAEKTILTFDDSAWKLFPDGKKMGTFNSFSIFIGGDNFSAENITFENSAGTGSEVGQAVAVYADADKARFKNCRFLGCQDTLFTGPLPLKPIEGSTFGGPGEGKPRRNLRQYYEKCFIKGDIDFIFGSATAVFNECEIFSNNRNQQVNGFITAASTPENKSSGYVFINCRLTSDAAPGSVFLGRPWRDHGKVAFINCFMGEHIKPEGWDNWNKTEAEKTVDYAEYKSYGPGAALKDRVSWSRILSDEEARQYSAENIFWIFWS
jgi:pectinesterase